MKLSRVASFILCVALLVPGLKPVVASPVEDLKPVGSTTLKVMFWTIYDSTLFTPDGRFSGVVPGLALRIDYRRNIARDRLIDTTREQWQELNLYLPELSEQWLAELSLLWPDIARGDSIILRVEADLAASFFYNGELLGRLENAEFTRRFLTIWLGEQSAFPKQRDELIGAG